MWILDVKIEETLENQIMSTKWNNFKSEERILLINYFLIFIIFALNFLGSPFLKYTFAAYALFTLISVLFLDLSVSIKIILTFCFLEGQGRILWEYNPIFRLAFDGILGVAMIKSWTQSNKNPNKIQLPKIMRIFILLHFLWYVVEIFNINSVSMMGHLAATKLYVFPFLLLMLFLANKKTFSLENLKSIGTIIIVLFVSEGLLTLFQLQQGEGLLLKITPYYENAFKGGVFIMEKFRPFATTHLPGAISVYLFLSIGLLFLREKFSKKYFGIVGIVIALSILVLLICQVRSATLKFIFQVVLSLGAIFFTSSNKLGSFLKISLIMAIAVPLLIYQIAKFDLNSNASFINLAPSISRWDNVNSYEGLKARRAGLIEAFNIAVSKLDAFPIGIGPGMTGAASSFSAEQILNDPVYTRKNFWGFDNFYLSMIVEFGYGCIFYLLFIFSIPVYLFKYFRTLYRDKHVYEARIILICITQIFIILLGNWWAIGLNYNPESFFFWFWTAIGFSTYALKKEKLEDQ